MDPTAIFTNIDDFRSYTEGLTADTTLDQLVPSIRTVASDIKAVITAAVFEAIQSFGSAATDAQKDAARLLKTALANGAMYRYQIFASAKKNGSDASLYKYQHEEIKEHYIEAFSRAMDELLDWLDENDTADYHESDQYKSRQELPIRSAREFNRYYGIDNSSYFFAKVLFLVRSNWQFRVKPLLSRDPERNTDQVMDIARHILAYRVIAQAVLQFDKTELPRCIRWDFNHEYTKGSDMQSREKLCAQLLSQVGEWEESMDMLLKGAEGVTDIPSDHNEEGNKFYMM